VRTPARFPHRHRPHAFQGRASRIYDVAARRLLRGVYRRLATDVAPAAPDDGTVLDVGTGPGVLLVELARHRPDLRLTGVDLSSDMAAAAERNLSEFGARASTRVGDVKDLPFPDQSFDLIVSSFSLHHWDDLDAAVAELARVLRPGGSLYVYDFRFAPFEAFTAAARARSVLSGQPPQRTLIRTRVPPFPRLVRQIMSSASP
jgi:ubiquinone/menaquinone biosynthesis C-methylase UbiE